MATWKKVLREDYAVGTTDGIINFDNVVATGSTGNITFRLYDTRDAVANLSDGEGLELAAINAGTGISIEAGGAIGLTNSGFTVSDGTNSSPIDLGDTLTIEGGGDITVTESAGTVTVSYTAEAQQAVGYTFSDGTTTEAITATNSNPTIQWTGGTFVDVGYTAATNTFAVDLNSQYNHITVTDGTTPQDITLGGTIQIEGSGDISVTQSGGVFTIDYTDNSAPNVFGTIAVSGQSDVVADSSTDTLTLAGANGLAITTTAASDTVTFTAPNSFGKFYIDGAARQALNSLDEFYFVEGDNITLVVDPNTGGSYGGYGMTINANVPNGWGNITVSDGDTTISPDTQSDSLSILAGTAIDVTGNATADSITISHEDVAYSLTNDGTGDASIAATGGTFDVITGLTVNAQGHTTGAVTSTITIANTTPQVADSNANTDFYLLLQAATGDLAAKIDSTTGAGPTYNPSTETLTVGNLTVDGTQTFLDTTHLAVSDKTITMAADSADAAAANGAAIHVGIGHDGLSETGINLLPKLKWNSASELSGWTVADYNAGGAVVDKHVSTMQFAPTASAPTAADRGDFHYDTTSDVLYVCIGN